MQVIKKISFGLLLMFVVIQLIPKAVNKNKQISTTDITKKYEIPDQIQSVFKKACFDCHSNNTSYPWYAHIQPFRFMLDRHVRDGKADLNFSEFGSYSEKRQFNKLKAIGESVEDETMPLRSYELFHPEARLSKREKDLVIKWINNTRSLIEAKKNRE